MGKWKLNRYWKVKKDLEKKAKLQGLPLTRRRDQSALAYEESSRRRPLRVVLSQRRRRDPVQRSTPRHRRQHHPVRSKQTGKFLRNPWAITSTENQSPPLSRRSNSSSRKWNPATSYWLFLTEKEKEVRPVWEIEFAHLVRRKETSFSFRCDLRHCKSLRLSVLEFWSPATGGSGDSMNPFSLLKLRKQRMNEEGSTNDTPEYQGIKIASINLIRSHLLYATCGRTWRHLLLPTWWILDSKMRQRCVHIWIVNKQIASIWE